MRVVALVNEALDACRLLERIQVLTLHVLDERHGECLGLIHRADDDGNLFEARHAGGAEAALAGDDFVALVRRTDDDRADDALLANGVSQLLKTLFRHGAARLSAARAQLVKLHRFKALVITVLFGEAAHVEVVINGAQTAAEASKFLCRHVFSR